MCCGELSPAAYVHPPRDDGHSEIRILMAVLCNGEELDVGFEAVQWHPGATGPLEARLEEVRGLYRTTAFATWCADGVRHDRAIAFLDVLIGAGFHDTGVYDPFFTRGESGHP